MKKILLIDGNSILNRAFYGARAAVLKNAEGVYTGAVHGFVNIYNKVVAQYKPDFVCVAFDLLTPTTFRHKMYEGYKAGRRPKPPELLSQFPLLKETLDALSIPYIEKDGFEADDILGTLSKLAADKNIESFILTGDRDALQLVDEITHVILPITSNGTTTTTLMTPEKVKEDMGVWPTQVIDLKALMGDSSDAYAGCPGIGETGAKKLLNEFESVDKIYENIDKIEKKKTKELLVAGKDEVYFCKKLAEIVRNVPLDEELSGGFENFLAIKEFDKARVYKLFKRLEFRKLIAQMGLEQGATSVASANNNVTSAEKSQAKKKKAQDDGDLSENYSLFSIDFGDSNEKTSENDTKSLENETDDENFYENKIFIITAENGFSYKYFYSENGEKKIICEELSFEEISKLKEILENEKIEKIFFDAKPFVLESLKQGINVKNIANDIKICMYLVDSSRKNDDYGAVSRYFAGEDRDTIDDLPEINKIASEKIKSGGFEFLLNEIELPLAYILAEMEYTGFKIDREILVENGKKYEENLKNLEKSIYSYAGHEFNINSPKQLGEVLFAEMKIAKGKKTKTGAYKTGAEILEEYIDVHPIVGMVLDYRQNAKLKSTYIDGLLGVIDGKSGRVYTTFNQTVTATGRLSSKEPNLQNIPVRHELGKVIREAFVADSNEDVIIDADYSQIELRVLAALSGDERMVAAFKNGEDIHKLTAAQVNNVPEDMVTPEMRSAAKAVNFGIVYGISEYGLAKDLKISVAAARDYINGYFCRFPSISDFLEALKDFARQNGFAKTPLGRIRYIPEIYDSKKMTREFGERVAMNMPIQGAAADIMKAAMVKVWRELKKRGLKAKILLQVHDELLINAPKCEEQEVTEILKNCMENAAELIVPTPVSISSGKRWEKS